MKYSFKKYVVVYSSLLLIIASCSKEGMPGPQGEPGLPGQDAVGGGSGGGSTTLISFNTSDEIGLEWEPITDRKYRLKFITPTHSGYSFTLPDSVTRYIDEGSLLVYARQADDFRAWYEMPEVAAEFYEISDRAYSLERIAGTGYRVSIFVYGPHVERIETLRFIVIPKTSSFVLD